METGNIFVPNKNREQKNYVSIRAKNNHMRQTIFSILIISALLNAGCSMGQTGNAKNKYPDPPIATGKTVYPMKFTDAE